MREEHYQDWTKAEMVEHLEARGYGRVPQGASKGRLLAVLVADDSGKVYEPWW